MTYFYFTECPKHCSLCYNATECYDCTNGYFLNEIQECESELPCPFHRCDD